jgi:hypothetical protein
VERGAVSLHVISWDWHNTSGRQAAGSLPHHFL